MKPNYPALKQRADIYAQTVTARMRTLSSEAGLEPKLLGIHPHNAMVSATHGKPWADVNYSKVRKILWLERNRLWEAHRIIDKLYKRIGHAGFTWQ